MSVELPKGFRWERLASSHRRGGFRSGQSAVDEWLAKHAPQHQRKRLSVTRVVVDDEGDLAGYYTLATGQIDFGELPSDIVRKLPRRALPVAILAWLGVDSRFQGQGLGTRLLAQALRDCFVAGHTFAFIAVLIDCVDAKAKAFYQRWQFRELPGRPMRLFLSTQMLDALMAESNGD